MQKNLRESMMLETSKNRLICPQMMVYSTWSMTIGMIALLNCLSIWISQMHGLVLDLNHSGLKIILEVYQEVCLKKTVLITHVILNS
jgi:hypothetical protein